MRIDVDGTGVAQMQRCLLGGDDYDLLRIEPCSEIPFAVFEIDPEPHTFFGRSIADLLMNEQDASTMMLLDMAEANANGISFVENDG